MCHERVRGKPELRQGGGMNIRWGSGPSGEMFSLSHWQKPDPLLPPHTLEE